MKEEFRSIDGYEELYEVSNFGNVRSLNYKRTGQTRVLKPGKYKDGYLQVYLWKDGKMKHHLIHRLVATAFIENPDNLPEVNHIDEVKTNNKVENLEWCDRKYNVNYGTRTERQAEKLRGVKRPDIAAALSEKVVQLTLDYIFIKEWESTRECGRNGFKSSAVSKCCRNEYCSQGNVYKDSRWMYAEDYEKMFAA